MATSEVAIMIKRKPKIDPTEEKVEQFFGRGWFIIKREWRILVNSMMYNKKTTNKIDRFFDGFMWWLKIVFIFFALKGVTYWMTGR